MLYCMERFLFKKPDDLFEVFRCLQPTTVLSIENDFFLKCGLVESWYFIMELPESDDKK